VSQNTQTRRDIVYLAIPPCRLRSGVRTSRCRCSELSHKLPHNVPTYHWQYAPKPHNPSEVPLEHMLCNVSHQINREARQVLFLVGNTIAHSDPPRLPRCSPRKRTHSHLPHIPPGLWSRTCPSQGLSSDASVTVYPFPRQYSSPIGLCNRRANGIMYQNLLSPIAALSMQ